MSSPQSHPTTFTRSELDRALSEQSFGITSYEITDSTELEASARVVLLEGNVIIISLTSRGYQVSFRDSNPYLVRSTGRKSRSHWSNVQVIPSSHGEGEGGHVLDRVFEEVEGLLQTVSNRYGQARQMALMQKLALLSAAAEAWTLEFGRCILVCIYTFSAFWHRSSTNHPSDAIK